MKSGLLLCLMGGSSVAGAAGEGGGCGGPRSEAHILLVGDPGLGKSQLLHACSNVAPRGKIILCLFGTELQIL